jgi:glycosyltransferase involved in cell wall biosynthesis
MPPTPIMFNGKFLRAPPTGVHRVAGELITHVDRILAQDPSRRNRSWSLIHPYDALAPLPLKVIERRRTGRLTWQWWEQFEAPGAARGAVFVNLCNLAPLAHRRCVTLIHDAQVFISPRSYSAAFGSWYRFALPRIGRSAARVLTVSEYSRDRLAEHGVAPREAISVLHNGADHLLEVEADRGVVDRLGIAAGRSVLAVASSQAHKNLGVLFKAFAGGALEGLTLVLVGGDGRQAFVSQGLSPPRDALFAGRVTDAELRALYEHAMCLAFPSTTEGFGLPPLEAMSLGCPTVVAPCGALPETCGDAALYAAAGDPAAWAAAIRRLSMDPELRVRTVRAGRERAAIYRWRKSARRLLDIIEEVA